ncbi:MAG TPA: crossover junction endodeoxyribonuclease RuvC [Candidatus Paceibacterota bacterium]|nr:crossover junction endodeoxyribonuclease RuvC [Candidatus Paceibacterota bacterium]
MKVLAFDPGYERLGVAVVEREGSRETLLYSDCIRTPAGAPFEDRLLLLGEAAEKLINDYSPTAVALEEIYFQKNEKTATKIAEVRGVLSYIARAHGLPVRHFTPQEVKIAVTGYGKGDKRAVTLMVSKLVSLPPRKRLDDEMDAIAIGLTCLATTRSALLR